MALLGDPALRRDRIAGGLAETGGTVCPIMLHLSDLGLTHGKESGIFSFTRRLLTALVRDGRPPPDLDPAMVERLAAEDVMRWAHAEFGERVCRFVARELRMPFVPAPNRFAALAGHEALVFAHGALKTLAAAGIGLLVAIVSLVAVVANMVVAPAVAPAAAQDVATFYKSTEVAPGIYMLEGGDGFGAALAADGTTLLVSRVSENESRGAQGPAHQGRR